MNVSPLLSHPRAAATAKAATTTPAPAQAASPAAPEPERATLAAPQTLVAPWLLIELDKASNRFVQTLVDPSSQSVLRRFPNEGQLAFSRGVNAYMKALGQT